MNTANPYAPPKAEVRDTVAHDEAQLAGRGERLGASLLDGLIGGILVGWPLFIGADFSGVAQGDFTNVFSGVGLALTGLLSLVLIGITWYLVAQNGQTIGKKIVGIKVVRSDFSRASVARIFWLRNVVNGIPSAIPFIGYLYTLVDHLFIFGERRQCVHDKIADTVVIKA